MRMQDRLVEAAKQAAEYRYDYPTESDLIVNWPEVIGAILAEMREPDETMVAAGMAHADTDLASEFTAMIDHLAGGA